MADAPPSLPRIGHTPPVESRVRLGVLAVELAHAHVDGAPVMDSALEILDHHIGAGFLVATTVSTSGDGSPAPLVRGPIPSLTPDEHAEWNRLMPRHPYAMHLATADPGVTRLTDVVDLGRFETTDLYQRLLAPLGARYQAALVLSRRAPTLTLLSLYRAARDFSDGEVAALETFRRPLAAAIGYRAAVLEALADAQRQGGAPLALTQRQRDVAALVSRGLTNAQIGRRLGISERTVRKHVEDIMRRTHLSSRTQLAMWWQRACAR